MAATQTRTGVIKFGTVGDAVTGLVDVDHLYWVNKAGGADEDLKVTDTAGNELWVDTADAINYSMLCPLDNVVNGIIAAVLDSGTLYVYKKSEWPL